MNRSFRLLALPALLTFAAACGEAGVGSCYTTAEAAMLADRPSPLDSAVAALGNGEAKVCYGSPSARDRQVMGGLVPFGQPWRFGANEATSLRLTVPATVGGERVEPGQYSVYAVPSVDSWEVVLNGAVTRWGIPIDGTVRAEDVVSFEVATAPVDTMIEALSMRLDPVDGGLNLVVEWETTQVVIPIRPLAQ